MKWPRRTPAAPEAEPAAGPEAGDSRPRRIPRPRVMRRLTILYDDARYLEVGVRDGSTFDRVPAVRKVAVDPLFTFDHLAPERQEAGVDYHALTSDDYFAGPVGDEQFDVVFLDGLHTFEQTLRDLTNTLEHLQPRGVVVVDDTRPPHERASLREEADFHAARKAAQSQDKRWSGDVFRLVWFLDTFYPMLEYRTIADNHGQTVIWRRPGGLSRPGVVDRRVAAIGTMDYADLVADEQTLRLAPYRRIRHDLCADLGLDPDRSPG